MIPAPFEGDFLSSGTLLERATDDGTLRLDLVNDLVMRNVIGYGLHEHTGSGRLRLDTVHKDPHGDPVPEITIELSEQDRAGFAAREEATRRLAEIFDAELTNTMPWSSGDRIAWGTHPSGGTAMGTSAKNGVCDKNLRVIGTDNLYLVSSSVFPHGGASNPTLTIVALALRLANHLLRR